MSTDLSNIHTAEEIMEYASIPLEIEIFTVKIRSFLSTLLTSVNKIWEDVDLKYYTKHNFYHSKQIIKYFMILDTVYNWSNFEKTIFITAALLHDIGMQFNDWAPKLETVENKNIYFEKTKLSDDEIRNKHGENGYKLINIFLKSDTYLDFPPIFCDKTNINNNDLLRKSAEIGFSHNDHNILDAIFNLKNEDYKSGFRNDQRYRPRLLAAMMTLCDELDTNYLRVNRPEDLKRKDISNTTKIHWLINLLIEEIKLIKEPDNLVYKVGIRWHLPEKQKENENNTKIAEEFIRVFKLKKIKSEIDRMNNLLDKCHELNHKIPIYCDDKIPDPLTREINLSQTNFQQMESVIHELYTSSIEKNIDYKSRYPSQIHEDSIIEKIIQTNKDLEKKFYPLQEKLQKWISNNISRPSHFALQTGDHTDHYITCRTLASDQLLIDDISEFITEVLETEKIEITTILAVGTSAIPLAVCTAFKLKCSISFTMDKSKVSNEKDYPYIPIEIQPIIQNDSKLLIIDDLISGGSVAKIVLQNLQDQSIKILKAYHFSIFRLGNREITKDHRIEKYYWLFHDPGILYYKDSDCQLCKEGTPIENNEGITN